STAAASANQPSSALGTGTRAPTGTAASNEAGPYESSPIASTASDVSGTATSQNCGSRCTWAYTSPSCAPGTALSPTRISDQPSPSGVVVRSAIAKGRLSSSSLASTTPSTLRAGIVSS